MTCDHKYIKLGYCEYTLPDVTRSVEDLAYGAVVTCEKCLASKLIQESDVNTPNNEISVVRIINTNVNCAEIIMDN